jgi:hypothetical protein
MPIFKLKKDSLWEQWYRDYYEVEAETIEEAVQMIRECDVEPYDFEPMYDFCQEPLEEEIMDQEGNILYDSKQL